SLDGRPFTVGQPVKIDAHLSGANERDLVYFFYSAQADSSNVHWEPLSDQPIQLTASGDIVVSASYTLPVGGVQAVRAALIQPLWEQKPVTPCISSFGPLEDHDDIVFAVNPGG
ncbi:MAG TPA: hypothetical protein VFQ61_00575, partial [Polyangiaceae bacterium]|nr:hypothetical protein [Polyangiaceae bacterium]